MKDRTVVGDFGIFRVERSKVTTADGVPKHEVHTFQCADWCNVVPVTPDGHVVFIWQYRFGSDALSLEVPGGMIDPGESARTAALRELEEESGYRGHPDALETLSVLAPNPALQGNLLHTFVARNVTPTGRTNFDDLEECETALIHVDDLPELLDSGVIQHALCAVAVETFLRRERR
jgi:ADP-ribose pyrophosphatase